MTFEKLELDYSMKNIPICTKNEYEAQLINKTKEFLRRMRIKAYFFENGKDEDEEETEKKETYGFKSWFNPQPSKYLVEFEKDMMDLINNIKFRTFTNHFQTIMRKDIETIKKSNKIIVKADKTSNIC